MPYWRDRNWLSITAIVCAIIFSAPIHCDFGFSLPGKICQNVSEVEVRYRDYYPFYLSSKPPQMARGRWKYQPGLLAKRITDAAKTCCPNVNVTFKWIGNVEPHKHVTLIAQREVLRSLLDKRNQSNSPQKFIFYFPEFTSGRVSEIYPYPTPFLSVLNSPGHAVVMLKSDAKRATSPGKLLAPSVPLVIVIFAAALIFGLAIWLLERWHNSEEFPRPFIRGILEGFWWSVVTMTTVGYGDKAPKNPLARLLAIVWMLLSYILLSLVAANIISLLTTQHISRIQGTIGLKIGTLNSKGFVEREMNLGAQIIDYNNSDDVLRALRDKEVDRLLFPHYIHFLMMAARNDTIGEDMYVAKVLDQPFQLGLVLTHPVDLGSIPGHRYFYYCLNSFAQRQDQMVITSYSDIKPRENISPPLMDTTFVLEIGKFLLFGVGGLISIGIVWDLLNLLNKLLRKQVKQKNTDLELNHYG